MHTNLISFCLTCAVGCIISLLLFIMIYRPEQQRKRHYPTLSSLLPYARCLTARVIALKEGALMSLYQLSPLDISCKTELEQEDLRDKLSRAMLQLDEGFILHLDVLTYADPTYYPQDLSRIPCCNFFEQVQKECCQSHPGLKRQYVASITKKLTKKKPLFQNLLFGGPVGESLRQEVSHFEEGLGPIEDALSLVYKVTPLQLTREGSQLHHPGLDYLYSALFGKPQKLVLPALERPLDVLLSCGDLKVNTCPQLGDEYVAVVAVDEMPSELEHEALQELCALPFPCRYSTRFISFDRKTSQKSLHKIRSIWEQKRVGFLAQVLNLQGARVDRNAVDQVDSTEEALREVNSHALLFGAYSAGVIVRDRDFQALRDKVSTVCKKLSQLGFVARVETINSLEAFLGSLPGDYEHNIRRAMVSNLMLSCLLPKHAVYEGERYSPNQRYGTYASPLLQGRTSSGENFFLNLHQQDLANSLIVGPPGAGKSVLLGALLLNLLRYEHMQVFAFDKGYSFYALCKTLCGNHIRFDECSSFAPLRRLDSFAEQEQALNLLELCLRLNHLQSGPQERLQLQRALNTLSESQPEERTFDDFLICLNDSRLEAALKPYIQGGEQALLNGRDNPNLSNPLTVFECSDLFERSDAYRLPVLNHVFNLIESTFKNGLPRAIILDEAWAMLGDNVFARKLLSWFKTLRKENVLVILATQSVSDFKKSGLFFDLLDCVKTRIFLPNPDALSQVESDIYTEMGLMPMQIKDVAAGINKHDYFLHKGEHFSRFNLNLPSPLLKLLSISGEVAVNTTDKLIEKYGREFYAHES